MSSTYPTDAYGDAQLPTLGALVRVNDDVIVLPGVDADIRTGRVVGYGHIHEDHRRIHSIGGVSALVLVEFDYQVLPIAPSNLSPETA